MVYKLAEVLTVILATVSMISSTNFLNEAYHVFNM